VIISVITTAAPTTPPTIAPVSLDEGVVVAIIYQVRDLKEQAHNTEVLVTIIKDVDVVRAAYFSFA
jgi:hypothetical protein